jgi:hypothetical protein
MFSKNAMFRYQNPNGFITASRCRKNGQQVTPRSLQRLSRPSESLRDWRDFRARLVQGVELNPV